MATPYHFPYPTAQLIGTNFVGQYYGRLVQQPDVVHQFYNDASTIVRIDGTNIETFSAMMQIHAVIMSLNYTAVEIKTSYTLESWNGGILVLVSGCVLLKDLSGRRNFVQTFFLAPQETGYFVLNDIFQFVGEDQIQQHPMSYLAPSIRDSKLNASTATGGQVSNYMLGGDFQARELVIPSNVEQNGRVENYSFPEESLQHVPETENIMENSYAVQQSNGSLLSTMNPVQDHLSSPIEEPAEEPQKHTYASIVAKGPSVPSVPAQSPFNRTTSPGSEWNHVAEPSTQPNFAPSVSLDRFRNEAVEEVSAEDEGEVKSVYVKNVPSTASAFEIEEVFKEFGKIKPDGVAIRTRKDIGVCYAFVEFEDIAGVQNAIKASTVQIAGQEVHIEGRRANRPNSFRGTRGRGRGRGSYHNDASRERFGARNFSRGSGQDGDYNRTRGNGNGYYRPTLRQEKAFSGGQQVSRNGSNHSE